MYCFFISIFAISIVLLPDFNMKRIQVLLLFIVISCSMFAQDRLSLFIGRANKYAAVELSDYRKRLCVEYNISNQLLDDYYRRCGSNWGNVGLALEIAKTSGRHMREVCDYYKRYHRNGWNRILVEIGIKPGSMYYDPFYFMTGFVIIANAGVNIIALIVTIMISIIASIIKNTSVINIINGTMMTMIGMMTMKTINTLIYF